MAFLTASIVPEREADSRFDANSISTDLTRSLANILLDAPADFAGATSSLTASFSNSIRLWEMASCAESNLFSSSKKFFASFSAQHGLAFADFFFHNLHLFFNWAFCVFNLAGFAFQRFFLPRNVSHGQLCQIFSYLGGIFHLFLLLFKIFSSVAASFLSASVFLSSKILSPKASSTIDFLSFGEA